MTPNATLKQRVCVTMARIALPDQYPFPFKMVKVFLRASFLLWVQETEPILPNQTPRYEPILNKKMSVLQTGLRPFVKLFSSKTCTEPSSFFRIVILKAFTNFCLV